MEDKNQKTATFGVTGMTCASCVVHVEHALEGVEGVQNANVNLASEKATVEYVGDGVKPEDLVFAVEDAGYGLVEAQDDGATEEIHQREYGKLKTSLRWTRLLITGESIPVTKREGDEVIGATMNTSGSFRFAATKVGEDTALHQIMRMVEEARGSKAPIQRLADRISAVFVPAVIGVAAVTFLVWLLFGPEPALTFALLNTVLRATGRGSLGDSPLRHGRRRDSSAGLFGAPRVRFAGESAVTEAVVFDLDGAKPIAEDTPR